MARRAHTPPRREARRRLRAVDQDRSDGQARGALHLRRVAARRRSAHRRSSATLESPRARGPSRAASSRRAVKSALSLSLSASYATRTLRTSSTVQRRIPMGRSCAEVPQAARARGRARRSPQLGETCCESRTGSRPASAAAAADRARCARAFETNLQLLVKEGWRRGREKRARVGLRRPRSQPEAANERARGPCSDRRRRRPRAARSSNGTSILRARAAPPRPRRAPRAGRIARRRRRARGRGAPSRDPDPPSPPAPSSRSSTPSPIPPTRRPPGKSSATQTASPASSTSSRIKLQPLSTLLRRSCPATADHRLPPTPHAVSAPDVSSERTASGHRRGQRPAAAWCSQNSSSSPSSSPRWATTLTSRAASTNAVLCNRYAPPTLTIDESVLENRPRRHHVDPPRDSRNDVPPRSTVSSGRARCGTDRQSRSSPPTWRPLPEDPPSSPPTARRPQARSR